MKRRACDLDEETVFRVVADVVSDRCGIPPSNVTRDARITEDLGAYGEDGADVIRALDQEFEMDWGDMRTDIHFGVEAFGPPLPWDRNSANRYKPQPLTVGRLVEELRSGRWSGTALEPISEEQLTRVIGCGWAQVGLFAIVIIAVIVGLIT